MFVIRHGQKSWNNKGHPEVHEGGKKHDAPLNMTDIGELKKHRKYMLKHNGTPHLIICSPLLRCRQTANILSAGKIPIVIDGLLGEFFTDVTAENGEAELLDDTKKFYELSKIKPKAETESELKERVSQILDQDYIWKYNLWLITHGAVVTNLHDVMYGSPCRYPPMGVPTFFPL